MKIDSTSAFVFFIRQAEPRTNIRQLMITMKYPKFKWLRQRITSLWPEWVKALDNLKKKSNNLASRKKLKVSR